MSQNECLTCIQKVLGSNPGWIASFSVFMHSLSKNIIIQLTSHHGLIETRCHKINSHQTNCHHQVNCHEIILQ